MAVDSFGRDKEQRETDAIQLLDDFELRKDAEFFSDESNRVEFLESIDADDFFNLCQHINARMRNTVPRERKNAQDKGSFLPMLGTPDVDEKKDAFFAGFNAIKQYLGTTNDDDHAKLRGVSMAAEALVVWVHPFNDGNGRTSRFIGKFIEEGTTDLESLVDNTVSNSERLRVYDNSLRVDTYNIFKGQDIMWDEGEFEEIQRTTEMPISEGIATSLTRLLEDKRYQDRVEQKTRQIRERRNHALARVATA